MSSIDEAAFKALEARVTEAEKHAQESEANLIRAAEAGKNLCEELSAIKSQRDQLLQENYSLKHSLDAKIALEANLMEELEIYKEASDKADEKHQDAIASLTSQYETKEKSWRSREQDLDAKLIGLTKENEALLQKLSKLEEDALKLSCKSPAPMSPSSDVTEELEQLKQNLTACKSQNRELEENNEELQLQVCSLRQDIVEMKEALEEKDAELASVIVDLGQFRKENSDPSSDDVDINIDVGLSKGNSLFSEVDDRRLLVEDQLKKYRSRLEELNKICEVKSRQISKLRHQNISLTTLANSGGSESFSQVKRLEDLLNIERGQNQLLTKRVQFLEAEADAGDQLKKSGTGGGALKNLRRETYFCPKPEAVSDVEGKMTDLEIQLRNQMRHNLVIDEKIFELTRQMSTLEQTNRKLKAENYQLKIKAQRLMERTPSTVADIDSYMANLGPRKIEKVYEAVPFSPIKTSNGKNPSVQVTSADGVTTDLSKKPSITNNDDDVFNVFNEDNNQLDAQPEVERKFLRNKQRATNMPTEAEPRKSVRFSDDTKDDSSDQKKQKNGGEENSATKENQEPDSPPKKLKKSVGGTRRVVDYIDAEEEGKKMEQQCAQQ